MLEEEEQVVPQAAVDAGLGERALPLERLRVRDQAGLHDLQHRPGHEPSPMALSWSPPAAAIAQRLAAVPTATPSKPHAIRPGEPRSRSATAARNPTSRAPTAAGPPMTPFCATFPNSRLPRRPCV